MKYLHWFLKFIKIFAIVSAWQVLLILIIAASMMFIALGVDWPIKIISFAGWDSTARASFLCVPVTLGICGAVMKTTEESDALLKELEK